MPLFAPSRIALAALLFATGITSSHALQLGETPSQIAAKHGAPSVEDHARHLAMYFWAGWSARLEYQDGVVAKLTYNKSEDIGATDLTSLLQANGGVSRWRETTPPDAKLRRWMRDDGAAAVCEADHPTNMKFEGGKAAARTLQQLGVAEPKVISFAAPGVSAPSPGFFPDPLAVEPRLDPKFSEISAPNAAPDSEQGDGHSAGSGPERSRTGAPPPRVPVKVNPADLPPVGKAAGSTLSQPGPLVRPRSPAETASPRDTAEVMVAPEPPVADAEAASRPAQNAGGIGMGKGIIFLLLGGGVAGALALLYQSFSSNEEVPLPRPPRIVPSSTAVAGLEALRSDQFELLIAEIHRRAGYTVEISAALPLDGSIDLTLRRNAETYLVQCGYWKEARVTLREMREFHGAMVAAGAPRGILASLGSFARDAREFAEAKEIDLLDREALEERIAAVARPGENLVRFSEWTGQFVAHSRIFDPECPVCGKSMTLRQNRTARSAFWACCTYPRCSGRREPRLEILDAAPDRSAPVIAQAA